MQSCSIRGCESYKTIQTKPVAYFKFPFTNEELLQLWLSEINQKNFKPNAQDQICSTHFLIEDIEPSSIGRYPVLKPDAVPSVFPEQREDSPTRNEGKEVKEIKEAKETKEFKEAKEIKEIKEAKEIKEVKEVKEIKNSPKPEVKPVIKKAPVPQFETVIIPDFFNQIPILPKPNLVQSQPQKIVQLAHQPNLIQPTKIITSPIQIQSRGLQIQPSNSKHIQIQPKPIQIRGIQLQPQLVKVQPQIQFQGKQLQFQQNSPVQIQQNSPIKIQQPTIQLQQSPPIQIQQKSPIPGLPSNGKLIPVKQINLMQLQEIFGQNIPKKQTETASTTKPNILSKSITENTSKTAFPDSRRPILKIQINKINDNPNKKPSPTKRVSFVKSKPEEVLIKALNKFVIFRLDSSGKIVVETKSEEEMRESNRQFPQNTKEVTFQDPKLNSLKVLYSKAQEDCEKLSKKLASLKQRHQEEQEQILKLQGQLSGNKQTEKSSDCDISASLVSKKRKHVSKEEEDDEYENLLKEVRKIKEDYDKNVFTKINDKDVLNIKTEEISIDSDVQDLETLLTQDQTINTTMNKKVKSSQIKKNLPVIKKVSPQINKIIMPEMKKSNIIERQIFGKTEKKIDEAKSRESPSKNDGEIIGLIEEEEEVEFDSEDEMNFEAEYLDPEFVDC